MEDENQLLDEDRPKIFAGNWKYPRTAATIAAISLFAGAYNVATTGYHPGEGLAILIDFTLAALVTFGAWYTIALLVGWTHRKLWHRTTPH